METKAGCTSSCCQNTECKAWYNWRDISFLKSIVANFSVLSRSSVIAWIKSAIMSHIHFDAIFQVSHQLIVLRVGISWAYVHYWSSNTLTNCGCSMCTITNYKLTFRALSNLYQQNISKKQFYSWCFIKYVNVKALILLKMYQFDVLLILWYYLHDKYHSKRTRNNHINHNI